MRSNAKEGRVETMSEGCANPRGDGDASRQERKRRAMRGGCTDRKSIVLRALSATSRAFPISVIDTVPRTTHTRDKMTSDGNERRT